MRAAALPVDDRPMSMEIRGLRTEDVPDAMALSRQAGWNQVPADWHRLLALAPDGCFAGCVEGTVVATSTLVSYGRAAGERVGWIGMVLVDEAHRRQGYGTRLFERALERAEAADVSTVGLDATGLGRPIYAGNGFVEVAPVARWSGPLSAPAADRGRERVVLDPDIDALLALDREVAGVDRRALLRHLRGEPESRSVAVADPDGDRYRGYAIVRPGRDHHQIGPLIARSGGTLASLLAAIEGEIDPPSVLVDVLAESGHGPLRAAGLRPERELVRMTRGTAERVLLGDGVVGAAGLELG